MPLTVIRRDEELTHVALSGQLDSLGVRDVEAEFQHLLAETENGRPMIVDLSAVEFIMSAGLNLLAHAAATLKRAGYRLVLLAPPPLVRKAVQNVALDKLAPVAETLEDALRLLSE